ncbi:MAG: hypothetical protein JWR59_1667 [Brevundimonas sp.]|nr:hypothetical protein [Brevundimonas sp.]
MQRKSGFKAVGVGMTRSGGLSASGEARKAPPSPFEAERKANQRAALNALKRARRAADKAGIPLSDWEGEFLESVSERVQTHGRAFGDPELGAPGQALSAMQGRKLKEIAKKANGEEPKRRWPRQADTKKPAE